MTWLPDEADGDTPLDRVLGLRPDLAAPYRAFIAVFWRDRLVDPIALDLCRLRVARLLRCAAELTVRTPEAVAAGLTEEQAQRVAEWPTAECFTDAERAALAFAEQFVLDPHGIAGSVRDDLRGPQRAYHRLCLLPQRSLRRRPGGRADRGPRGIDHRWLRGRRRPRRAREGSHPLHGHLPPSAG